MGNGKEKSGSTGPEGTRRRYPVGGADLKTGWRLCYQVSELLRGRRCSFWLGCSVRAVLYLENMRLWSGRRGGHALSLYVEYGFGMRNRVTFAVASIGACPLYRCDFAAAAIRWTMKRFSSCGSIPYSLL